MKSKNKPEIFIYYLIIAILSISMLGLSYMRYLAYLLPLIVLLFAILLKCVSFKIDRVILPHIILLFASLLTAYAYDYNSIKKVLFIFSYTSIFVFVDFSKVKLNLNIYGIALVIILALQIIFGGGKSAYSVGDALVYSLIDSKSSFESTLSFPFALLASFYILKSRWLASIIYIFLTVITLKRIALLAIFATIISKLLPKKVGNVVFGNVVVTSSILLLVYIVIIFSYGGLDGEISDLFNKSANDLSKGRQNLWLTALEGVNYSFNDFILFGVGVGKVVTELRSSFGVERILLHNDILSIYLEYGLIILLAFVVSITSLRIYSQKVLAVNLLILFLTDNVMIYQLVMITYFIVQSQVVNASTNSSK